MSWGFPDQRLNLHKMQISECTLDLEMGLIIRPLPEVRTQLVHCDRYLK